MKTGFLLSVLFLLSSCTGCSSGDDSVEPIPVPEPEPEPAVEQTYASGVKLRGGDISELTYVEQNGGKYYLDGKAQDCLDILQQAGINVVRLRLYNDPGNKDYSPSNRLPAGIQDEDDILSLAKRAKDHGMQIVLSFHYSDYWTNGETQIIPHEWEAQPSVDSLGHRVYDYTVAFLKRMEAQNTLPEYVALGNEIQAGILYPTGKVANVDNLCQLLQRGAEAVRAAAPRAKIILHLDGGGDKDKYNWFFGEMRSHGVDYDVIGASYYPFWTGKRCDEIAAWADEVIRTFNKPMLLMETGYAWTANLPDGTGGQLSHNKPYTDLSPKGQKDFMIELNRAISQTSATGQILGYLYWDPVMIEANGIGWELGAKNVVSNSTFFDFKGNALPVLEAFK